MTVGEVFRKEREKRNLSVEETASRLTITADEYRTIEGGDSPIETWGPLWAALAIHLQAPMSRLLAESGRWEDTREGQACGLIRSYRKRCEKSAADLAAQLGITSQDYEAIEAGGSPIEKYGPLCLRFAEIIEQPVFNLFYPCGLPAATLDDYP